MTSLPTDPFFRQLYNRLAEEIDSRGSALIRGAALTFGEGVGVDAMTTAMNYQKQVSYIQALQDIIELGLQFDKDRYGSRTTDDGDE